MENRDIEESKKLAYCENCQDVIEYGLYYHSLRDYEEGYADIMCMECFSLDVIPISELGDYYDIN